MPTDDTNKRPTVSFNKGGIAAAVLAATLEAIVPSAQAAETPASATVPLEVSPQAKNVSGALNMDLTRQQTMQEITKALKLDDQERTIFFQNLRKSRDQFCQGVVQNDRSEFTFFLDEDKKRRATLTMTRENFEATTQQAELTNDPNKPNYVPTGDKYSQPLSLLTRAQLAKTEEERQKMTADAMNQQRAKNAAQPKP